MQHFGTGGWGFAVEIIRLVTNIGGKQTTRRKATHRMYEARATYSIQAQRPILENQASSCWGETAGTFGPRGWDLENLDKTYMHGVETMSSMHKATLLDDGIKWDRSR